MHLIATQEFYYNFKTLKAGDEFEAPEIHGKMFIESKRARAKEKMSTKTYETAAMTIEPQVEVAHNPRGKYKRRDMRSEQ